MKRVHLYLETRLHAAVKAAAVRAKSSVSAEVRRLIEERFGDGGDWRSAIAQMTGLADVPGVSGAEHDAALYGPRNRSWKKSPSSTRPPGSRSSTKARRHTGR